MTEWVGECWLAACAPLGVTGEIYEEIITTDRN